MMKNKLLKEYISKNFHIKIIKIFFLTLFFNLSIFEINGATGESSKRHSEEEGLVQSPLKKQVFGRATYDTTAKYVLSDPAVRLEFIRIFTGRSDIESTKQLDVSLNPIKKSTKAHDLLNDTKNKSVMKQVEKNPDKFKVQETYTDGSTHENKNGTEFLQALSSVYGDLTDAFPKERNSQMDVICQLSNGDLALVEIQVAKEDYWDRRALAYVAAVYGNQLASGGKWDSLKKVIGINILGNHKGIRYWSYSDHFKRHYCVIDKDNPSHVIDGIELIQYSLGNVDADNEDLKKDENLKNWLEFFKDAHHKQKIPDAISEELKKAYALATIETMPDNIRKSYQAEELKLDNFQEYMAETEARGIEKGIKQANLDNARKMKEKGISKEDIHSITGVFLEEIENL